MFGFATSPTARDRRRTTVRSPEWITGPLRIDYPHDVFMRISHKANYPGQSVQSRGGLTLKLVFNLQAGPSLRVPRPRVGHRERCVQRSKPLLRPGTSRPTPSPRLCARLAPIRSACLRAASTTGSSCRCSWVPRTGGLDPGWWTRVKRRVGSLRPVTSIASRSPQV